jgi:hypothetical protein
MGVHPQLLVLVLEADILISPSPIFWVTLGTPQNKSLYMLPSLKKKPNSFWHPCTLYIHGSWIVSKQYEIKWRCYLEHLEEHFGPDGNTLETSQNKKMPSTPLPPRPKPKRKKLSPGGACRAFLLTVHGISIFKTLCHHFQPELLP